MAQKAAEPTAARHGRAGMTQVEVGQKTTQLLVIDVNRLCF